MKKCGIIAEYNPFHKGHLYQIQKIKEELGDDTLIVCCMSGDFVQRGEAAIMNKMLRAEAAVRCGADLVLSLPLRWSLSSAQGFADGAVRILAAAGADYLAFGAENADIDTLSEIAELVAEKSVLEGTIQNMQEGLPFAVARERELYKRIKEKAALISMPNNILAVEYLRAVKQQGLSLKPLAIQREGAGHDMGTEGDTASASYIRELVKSGKIDEAERFMPEESYNILRSACENGLAANDLSRLDCAMTAVLSRLTAEDMSKLPDSAEGIENRLEEAVRKGRTFEEICDIAKTKRYAHSRIRRMLYSAFLGIEKKDHPLPVFSRVLAFNDRGRRILSDIDEECGVTFITKPAYGRKLEGEGLADFELEAKAAAAYDMILPAYMSLDKSREWTKGPVYVRNQKKDKNNAENPN